MIGKSPKIVWGVLSFSIYFTLIGLLVYYFNTRDEKKPVRYVEKNEHRIQVALSSSQNIENKKAINPKSSIKSKPQIKPKLEPKSKSEPKPKPQQKPKAKPEPKPEPKKVEKKKVIEEKVVKKTVQKKNENLAKPKKKALDLFANVKTPKKTEPHKNENKKLIKMSDKPIKTVPKNNLIKVVDKPVSASERISSSLKEQQSKDSGVENAYLARVQRMLEGWPAQSEYAGEKIKVMLHIDPTGRFEFKLKSFSNNENFNAGLVEYLEQLQTIGFGPHKGGRTYNFEAEFIAKG